MNEKTCKWCGAGIGGRKTKFCSATHRVYDKQYNWLSRQKKILKTVRMPVAAPISGHEEK